MTRTFGLALALGAGLAALVGCGHATYVSRTQTGGVLALKGSRQKAMEDAANKMSAHCRGPYTVIREGQFVVGSQTHTNDREHTDYDQDDTYSHGSSTTTTQDVTEWRVEYVCGNAPPPPQQPPAGYDQQPPPPPNYQAPPPPQQPPPPPDQGAY